MNLTPKNLFKLGLLTILVSGTASAMPAFTLYGGGNFSDLKETGTGVTDTTSSAFGLAGGASLEFSLAPHLGLELGALYVQRKIKSTVSGVDISFGMNMVEIPLLFRISLGPLRLGAGGYYAQGMGNIKLTATFEGTSTTSDFTYDALNFAKSDYGLMGVLGLGLPLAPMTSFLIEGRVGMGLKDIDTSADEAKFFNIQALAGLRFGI